jgi:adenylate cyclase
MRRAPALIVALVAAAIAGALQQTTFGERAEGLAYDWRVGVTADPAGAHPAVAIVEIDDDTVRALEPIYGRWPWPRVAFGGVVRFLSRAPARVIVFDVLFTERHASGEFRIGDGLLTGAASDQMFVDEVRRAGNVILVAEAVGGTLMPPFESVGRVAAGIGHNVTPTRLGVAREMRPFIGEPAARVPSLGFSSARFWQSQPAVEEPAFSGDRLLRFRGPFRREDGGSPYPVHQFFNVLLSEEQLTTGQRPAIDPAAFRDKVVFVGTSAAGLHDLHPTPFGGVTPGVFLQATGADNVLSNEFMRRAGLTMDLGLTLAAGLAAALAALLLPVWGMALAVTGLAAALVVGTTALVDQGIWVALVAPLVAATLAAGGAYAWRYVVEDREKRRVKKLFGRYVSKDVFDQLMANPALAQLGGERREMTVLFSDIRGFTTASEKSTPEAVVAQLNEYFGAMVEVLFRHRGTLDKFVGDMVMGLFGAPVADPLHADHAVQAGLEMLAELDRLNARWATEGRPRLNIGIGISSGVMIAGNIGSSAIMSYTVIGDTVNLGSRLESLNKEYGTRMLISDATKARLTMPVKTRQIGEVTVKGKTEPVVVHEVTP